MQKKKLNLEEPNPKMVKLRKEIKDLRKRRIIILKIGEKTPKEKIELNVISRIIRNKIRERNYT